MKKYIVRLTGEERNIYEQEAFVIALRLGPPPEGCGSWSLRLLARRVVELGIADSISRGRCGRR